MAGVARQPSFICWCACAHTQRALISPARRPTEAPAGRFERWYFVSPEARRSPTSRTSSPGRCAPVRIAAPSATRTRKAANPAASGPLVPRRQAIGRHFAPASRSSAGTGAALGTGFGRGLPVRAFGQSSATSVPQAFCTFGTPTRDARGPAQAARRERLAEQRAVAVARVGGRAAEAGAERDQPVDLGQRHLALGRPRGAALLRHAGPPQPRRIGHPLARQGPGQRPGRRSATGTGTSPRASVSETRAWQLAFLPSAPAYRWATPTEAEPFFGRAVSSTTGTASGGAAEHGFGLRREHGFERRAVPGRAGDEVVQLVVRGQAEADRHRLHALAPAGQQQAAQVVRRPVPPGRMAGRLQEGIGPRLQLAQPALAPARHRHPPPLHTALHTAMEQRPRSRVPHRSQSSVRARFITPLPSV